jgi:hypothetical protein
MRGLDTNLKRVSLTYRQDHALHASLFDLLDLKRKRTSDAIV